MLRPSMTAMTPAARATPIPPTLRLPFLSCPPPAWTGGVGAAAAGVGLAAGTSSANLPTSCSSGADDSRLRLSESVSRCTTPSFTSISSSSPTASTSRSASCLSSCGRMFTRMSSAVVFTKVARLLCRKVCHASRCFSMSEIVARILSSISRSTDSAASADCSFACSACSTFSRLAISTWSAAIFSRSAPSRSCVPSAPAGAAFASVSAGAGSPRAAAGASATAPSLACTSRSTSSSFLPDLGSPSCASSRCRSATRSLRRLFSVSIADAAPVSISGSALPSGVLPATARSLLLALAAPASTAPSVPAAASSAASALAGSAAAAASFHTSCSLAASTAFVPAASVTPRRASSSSSHALVRRCRALLDGRPLPPAPPPVPCLAAAQRGRRAARRPVLGKPPRRSAISERPGQQDPAGRVACMAAPRIRYPARRCLRQGRPLHPPAAARG
mmetsp:Transcript_22272/g.57067  ORF Transcript_22272/g.57067 Transcript_22272/m.57067 type:complete len:448 (+) Transcript_22272:310-1653(+)